VTYVIESAKGFWLPGGYGYTKDFAKAGRFPASELVKYNLDGCTLHRV